MKYLFGDTGSPESKNAAEKAVIPNSGNKSAIPTQRNRTPIQSVRSVTHVCIRYYFSVYYIFIYGLNFSIYYTFILIKISYLLCLYIVLSCP